MEGSIDTRTAVRAILTKGANVVGEGTAQALTGLIGSSPYAVVAEVGIVATVAALKLGISTLEAHAQASRDANTLFVEDYNTGTVSVFLPEDESRQTGRERFFAAFLQLLQEEAGRNSPLFRYAGIRYTDNVDMTVPGHFPGTSTTIKGTRYSLISMPTLVFAGPYEYARSGDTLLDIALHGSDLTLDTELEQSLSTIFQYESSGLGILTEHNITTRKFTPDVIRRLDLVRFMIIVFANLLSNLQHPSDLDVATNIPLDDEAAINLCHKVIALIHAVLLPDKKDKRFEYLSKLYCKETFNDFINLVKREAEELQEGYQSKKLKQINLLEVIAQSHGILQVMNTLWHQLIYLDKPLTKPAHLLTLMRVLSNALDDHPEFWTELNASYEREGKPLPQIQGLNQTYHTVIDLVGVFISLSASARKKMLSKIQIQAISSALEKLNQNFIDSLQEFSRMKNPAQGFLMNLIALSMESHPPFLQEAVVPIPEIPTLQQHFAFFNDTQMQEHPSSAFSWDTLDALGTPQEASSFLLRAPPKPHPQSNLNAQTLALLKQLRQAQYHFIGALRHVNAVQELLEGSRQLLLKKGVRSLLKKVLISLRIREEDLSTKIQTLYMHINMVDKVESEKDDASNYRRKFILQMEVDKNGLKCRVKLIKHMIDSAITILDSPIFTKQLAAELMGDVNAAFASQTEFETVKNALLEALKVPENRSRPQITNENQLNLKADIVLDEDHALQDDTPGLPIVAAPERLKLAENALNASPQPIESTYTLEWVLHILKLVSTFLLIVGMLTLISLTLGAPYISVIAALSANQFTIGLGIGAGCTVMGTVGLGLSCFFKPNNEASCTEEVRWFGYGAGIPA